METDHLQKYLDSVSDHVRKSHCKDAAFEITKLLVFNLAKLAHEMYQEWRRDNPPPIARTEID